MRAQQQEQLAKLSNEFQTLQRELSNLIESRQKLEAQSNENEAVAKEFQKLSLNEKIYKLVGTALLLQEQNEAKQNVEKRLELIRGDMKRTDQLIQAAESKMETKKNEIVRIQTLTAAQAQAGEV
ncbi:Prefoldin [Tilletiaria anomala UBC 951]|uniref:Prefoldin n=1 Tax=Tilletiaria anomala (strain ATCC 24038 / CBS 436.72 / UBC 951) TaxID=1037660 RepID=A0A066WLN2_TILAU|nr:Prefoldin [Tilletiaria anomala UBC 951]KDN53503.1 Prefoldin [Tilletiaria anomala UBC 951]